MPNHWHADAVSADVVRLVVAFGKSITLSQSHQSCGFPGGQQSRSNLPTLDHENRLARGAAGGRAKAAGDLIEANFGALTLCPLFVRARAPIDRADGSPAQVHGARHLLAMQRRHQFQQVPGVGRAVPFHACRDVFQHVRKSKAPRGGLRDRPPDPACFRLRRQSAMRPDQRIGMPLGLGFLGDERTWDCLALASGDEKNAGSRLRKEMRRVDDRRPKSVSGIRERGGDGGEILSAVRRQTTDHIFKDDGPWRTAALARARASVPRTAKKSPNGSEHCPAPGPSRDSPRRGRGPGMERKPRRGRRDWAGKSASVSPATSQSLMSPAPQLTS